MTQKKLYVIILSFFTIIIGVVCFSLGNYFDTNSLATEKLKNQNSSLQATEKTGKTYTLKKDQSYTCPSEIPAGRYIATGTGTLVIYSSSGKARVSEDLAVAYNNSYSFTLSEKEKIKATDDIKLTEIKSN